MAQIPLGNFEQVQGPAPVQTGAPDLSGTLAASRAGVEIGQQLQGIGDQGLQHQVMKQKEDAIALANAKAQNALDSHDLQVKAATADIAEQIQTKQLDYNAAPKVLADTVSKIPVEQIAGLEPAQQERYQGQVRNNVAGSGLALDNVVKQARRDDGVTQFTTALDLAGKKAGEPGADIATINQGLKEWIQNAAHFGMPEATATKAVQDRIDANWTNQALQVFNAHKEDAAGLQTLQHALTDPKGYYVADQKLDTEKRDAINSKITQQLYLLDAKQEVANNKIEKAQEGALVQMGEQDTSGIPYTAAQEVHFASIFPKGSPLYDEYQNHLDVGNKIQNVLRLSIDKQTEYVQQQQTALEQSGKTALDPEGGKHARANQARLTAVVAANTKLLTEQPMTYAEERLGVTVKPLDLAAITQPGGAGKITAQLEDRMATIGALSKSNGIHIAPNVLKPDEQKLLMGTLDPMDPKTKVQTLGDLRKNLSESTYMAVMHQIAPDSPLTAMGGELAAMQRQYSPDTLAVNGNVGELVLRGEALLNPTKSAKAQDGKGTPYPMPNENKLRKSFSDAVGDTFANRPDLAELRYQGFKAYYAGRSAERGINSVDEVDDKIAADGIAGTVGYIDKFNGHSVQAPYGMTASDFRDQAEFGARGALDKRNLTEDRKNLIARQAYYVQIHPDGAPPTTRLYVLAIGRDILHDGNNKPYAFRINSGTAAAVSDANALKSANPWLHK
jgi:hypothetical protein